MSDRMREQLGAYLDGELQGASLQALQAHLETCADCREELAALRQLSETLRQAPLPLSLPSAVRFSDQLVQRLPPRPAPQADLSPSRGGWLVPVGMLIGLVLVQAASLLSMLAGLAVLSGVLDGIAPWFTDGSAQTLWFSVAQTILQNVLNLSAPANLQVANDAVVSLQQWLINPLLQQLILTLAYTAGLVIWWYGRRSSQAGKQVLE